MYRVRLLVAHMYEVVVKRELKYIYIYISLGLQKKIRLTNQDIIFTSFTSCLNTLNRDQIKMRLFYLSGEVPQYISVDYHQRTWKKYQQQKLASLGHTIVDTCSKRKKTCVVCLRNDIRSRKGDRIRVRQQCGVCAAPLCIGYRDCFVEYHKTLLDWRVSETCIARHSYIILLETKPHAMCTCPSLRGMVVEISNCISRIPFKLTFHLCCLLAYRIIYI